MTRLLPQPLMSAALLFGWPLLHNSFSAGVLVSGVILAVTIPWFTARFWPEYPTTVRLLPLIRLVGIALFDIIIANLRIAVLILGPVRRLRPHFIVIPVELTQPFAITLFASIISLTPGTVSANLSGDRRRLLVHDLNIDDPDEAVARIKARYEKPLMEIFE